MKDCPYCGQPLDDEAEFCLFCMKRLGKKEIIAPPSGRSRGIKMVAFILAGLLIIAVALCFILLKNRPRGTETGAIISDLSSQTGSENTAGQPDGSSSDFGDSDIGSQNPFSSEGPFSSNGVPQGGSQGPATPGASSSGSQAAGGSSSKNPSSGQTPIPNTSSNNSSKVQSSSQSTTTSTTSPSQSSSNPASSTSSAAKTADFSYREVSGGIEITGGWDSDKHNMKLSIPSYIDGKKVVGIGQYAFNGEYIAELTLPDTLTYIDEGAFMNAEMLGKVKIPANVTRIENQAFMGCRMLLHFYIYSKDIFVHHYALPNPYPLGRDGSLSIYAYQNVLDELDIYIKTVWEATAYTLSE
ncbi:MAG: hypothetical protein E7550_03280 [Ruminococcaceae bacterium]|nr:hypothetical protein [Oscillospiraceae bacterium]